MPSLPCPPEAPEMRLANCRTAAQRLAGRAVVSEYDQAEECVVVLQEMRRLFASMEDAIRHGAVNYDAQELTVIAQDCMWRAARADNAVVLAYLIRERQVDPRARRALEYAERNRSDRAKAILLAAGALHP